MPSAGPDPGMAAKLGIIAGGGGLPARLIESCRASGRAVFVLAFEGQTDPASVEGAEHAWIHLGQAGSALKILRDAGVEELVMAGPIRRPGLRELKPDLRVAAFMAKAALRGLGDDGLLSGVVRALEDEGFRVVGVDDILGDLVAVEGCYGVHTPDEQARQDIARGVEVARALGAADVGQAVVVQQGMVLGVEAAEGTDMLLRRCAELRRAEPGGVLVKMRKPQQDRRVDLPAIGLHTLETAAAAGLSGIAVEAGGALIVDRDAVVTAADTAGLFLIGLEAR